MKLLIAYDGSACSEAALDDLTGAGLPEFSTAHVMSVAEVWLPTLDTESGSIASSKATQLTSGIGNRKPDGYDNKMIAEAEVLVNHAKQRVQRMFPRWKVTSESIDGSPARAILKRAAETKPDLIVLGSHGRSSISRMFLGSISQKVLTEADCCVRVARGRIEIDPTSTRLIIGFDGSKGSQAAVSAVAERSWRGSAVVRVVVATSEVTPPAIGRFVQPIAFKAKVSDIERDSIEKLAQRSLTGLRAKSVSATLHLYSGNPKEVIVDEATRWSADCIFLGASSFGSDADGSALGSTSAAVAARAMCSVEVVRRGTID